MSLDRWPDVTAWAGVRVIAELRGGARASVFAARRGDERLVVKVSRRPAASLGWELDLLTVLGSSGIRVPAVAPSDDGRLHDRGVVVQSFLPGEPPRTPQDWLLVQRVVGEVHRATRGWPQRPGSASADRLLREDRAADVDLTVMPAEVVTLLRRCWRAVLDLPGTAAGPDGHSVVHGDLGAGNIRIEQGVVGLLDWDEARVDLPLFDLADLTAHARADRSAESADTEVARTAALAWEVATSWSAEPGYARGRLRDLETRLQWHA